MNLKEATLRAAVGKLLREKIDEADKAGRVNTLQQLIAAHDALGVKSVDVLLPDGAKVGTATLPTPKPGVAVDESAFMDWVLAEHSGEVVQAVRESFRRAALARLKIVGDDVVDKSTGEVVSWAKVRPAVENPTSFTVRFTDDGRAAIEQAWQDGRLNPLDYVSPNALPSGGED